MEDVKAEQVSNNAFKLDYSIESAKERVAYIEKMLAENPNLNLSNKYLEIMGDYIIFAMDKEERRNKKILTDNRMVTVNKRETSFEGLVGKLENGEDGIYGMMSNNKNILLTPKIAITEKDIKEVPGLKELREQIEKIEKLAKEATGKRKFLLKKQVIEMRQDQYILKNNYYRPISCLNPTKNLIENMSYDEDIKVVDGEVIVEGGITLLNPQHVSAILCDYSNIRQDTYGKFSNDMYYIVRELDDITAKALADYPLYYDLLVYKVDGKQNLEIQELLFQDYGIKHSVEYISSLWRNKIPKLIADKAQEEYLIWYYTCVEKGKWKRCSRCGQVKLAHNRYFSKNKTSKDGFYSICKDCRNGKTKKNKE